MNKRIIVLLITSVFNFSFIPNLYAYTADAMPGNVKLSVITGMEAAFDLDNADSQKLVFEIQPETKIDLGPDSQLTVLGRFRADAQDNINPDKQSKAELREFYLETSYDETFLTIGKQQIVWGNADGLKVLDVVNPQDFREFILDEFDESRIPLWMINAEIPFEEAVLQLLLIADQTYHKFAEAGAEYSFTSPLVSPVVPDGVAVVMQNPQSPGRALQNADVAMRISSFLNGWDVTFNYLYHYGDVPVFFREIDLSMAIPIVTFRPEYKRTQLFGGSFSNAFDSLTLRGEVAYSIDHYFSINDITDKDGVLKSDEFTYILGFDWQGIEDTFLSLQLFQSYVVNDDPGLVRDPLQTSITLLYRQQFYNQTLQFETLLIHNLEDNDGLVRPKIDYQWQDGMNVWVGFDIFYGEADSLFGQYDASDRLIVGMEWGISIP